MVKHLRLGIMAIVCMFAVASVVPAEAQRRGSAGARTGASAAPRQAQAPPPAAAPRGPQGSGQAAGPRGPQGSGAAARPRGPQGPGPAAAGPGPQQGTGHYAVPRPGPGYGHGPQPGYGYNHGYPGYYRGYYPYYGGYYPRYSWGLYLGFGGYYGPYVYNPWYYSPYWYNPYYYGYGYGYGYGYYGYDGVNAASLKVNVEPKNAEVYVDGHLAGIVDQFDGMFQSLGVEAGGHDITIYLDGYRTIRQQIYASPGSTYRIKGVMEKLAPGEPADPRPQAAPEPQQQYQDLPQYQAPEPQGPPPQYRAPEPQVPPPVAQAPETYPPIAGDSRFGQVAIRVQPEDAEVLIDGQPWRSSSGSDRLVVHLSPGTHRVEIRKDGYDSFVTAVEIKRGETAALNVSLAKF